MPLVTHEDLVAPARSDAEKHVYDMVAIRTHSDARPMPPPPNMRLNAADQATIDNWIAAGAPSSDAECGPAPDMSVPKLDCSNPVKLRSPTPYMIGQGQNQYVCYGVDLTTDENKHIVGMTANIDNAKVVHHVLLFQSDSAYSPTPKSCSAGGAADWRLMFGWAPGGRDMQLPKEAGFPMQGTKHYVVQIHYNNAQQLMGETDGSGFDLCTGEPRANEADVLAFGTQTINMAANTKLDKTCSVSVTGIGSQLLKGKKMIAAMPHMHQLGTAIETWVDRKGQRLDLGSVPNWDFNNQYWMSFDVTLEEGDTIRTRCAWDNKTGKTVKFGEGTEDEMCYSFTMYYPKISTGIPGVSAVWLLPATTSQCKNN